MTRTSNADMQAASTVILPAQVDRSASLDVTSSAKPLLFQTRPRLMTMTLLVMDLLMLSLAMLAGVYGRWALGTTYDPTFYLQFWPLLALFVLGYAGVHLYPGVPLLAVDELRRLSWVTTIVFIGLAAMTFMVKEGHAFSRGALLMSWVTALVLVPAGRMTLRKAAASRPWWGYTAMVLGDTPTARRVVRALRQQPHIGLKPVLVVGENADSAEQVAGVPMINGLKSARKLGRRYGVSYAIVAMPQMENERLGPLLERLSTTFHHLIFVPDIARMSSLWVSGVDLGGTLGMEVRHRLLDPGRRSIKRVIDLALIFLSLPLLLPLVGVIAVLIKLDSAGPAFYSQMRIGMHGQRFRAWMFRTMVQDGDDVLQHALEQDPALRAEWEATCKLRHDPRTTRIGRWLRRTSLDELPQLWNVVRGEMSLVGPRPIPEAEHGKYGRALSLYKKVRPGLTGLWQVSGRSELTYDERIRLDCYYVRNWSVWLDIYLLLCTFPAVIRGRGAY